MQKYINDNPWIHKTSEKKQITSGKCKKNKSQLQNSKKKCKSTKIIQYRLIHAQKNNALNRPPPSKKKNTKIFDSNTKRIERTKPMRTQPKC